MGFREEALRDLHTVGSIRENGDQDEADTLHQYGGRLIIAGAVASFCLTGVLYLTEARVPAGAQADWGLLFSETLKLRASSMFEVSILTGYGYLATLWTAILLAVATAWIQIRRYRRIVVLTGTVRQMHPFGVLLRVVQMCVAAGLAWFMFAFPVDILDPSRRQGMFYFPFFNLVGPTIAVFLGDLLGVAGILCWKATGRRWRDM